VAAIAEDALLSRSRAHSTDPESVCRRADVDCLIYVKAISRCFLSLSLSLSGLVTSWLRHFAKRGSNMIVL